MSDPITIVVVLKAAPEDSGPTALDTARGRLEVWAATRDVNVLPTAFHDYDNLRFAYVQVSDLEQAVAVEKCLVVEPYVDAAYYKPPDEPADLP